MCDAQVLDIAACVHGLLFLFLVSGVWLSHGRILPVEQEPNPEDPLNKEAADQFVHNRELFRQMVCNDRRGGGLVFKPSLQVRRTLRGGYVGRREYPRLV